MLRYAIKRLLQSVPLLLLVSLIAFGLIKLVPGDPAIVMGGTNATQAEIEAELTALSRTGVPYSREALAKANDDLRAQADPDADSGELLKRYPKAQARDFDGDPARLTEMDALVAYLQVLGTLVDVNSAAAQEELATEKGR